MRRRAVTILLCSLALGCGPNKGAAPRDSAAAPDTAAILGTGAAPLPTPAAVDSERARRDSAGARKRP